MSRCVEYVGSKTLLTQLILHLVSLNRQKFNLMNTIETLRRYFICELTQVDNLDLNVTQVLTDVLATGS